MSDQPTPLVRRQTVLVPGRDRPLKVLIGFPEEPGPARMRAALQKALNDIRSMGAETIRTADIVSGEEGGATVVTWVTDSIEVGVPMAQSSKSSQSRSESGLPRIWDLVGLIFDVSFRERVWTPSICQKKADYYRQRKRYRSKWIRRWILLCFGVRTLVLLLQCFWELGLGKLVVWLAPLLPEWVRYWWWTRL